MIYSIYKPFFCKNHLNSLFKGCDYAPKATKLILVKGVKHMNQILIGKYIARKRKEKNLTQAQLAERLNVSNKTISKWENGNCMPDYSVIEVLCRELGITISELMDGEDSKKESDKQSNNIQLMFLLKKMQELDKQNKLIYGFLIVVMGIALLSLSRLFTGSNIMDFFSGLFLGLSIGTMLIGVFFIGKNLKRQ